MDESTYNVILLIAGAVITALLYINHKQSLNLAGLIPADVASVLLNLLGDLAARTVTTEDDAVVEKLKELLQKPTVPPTS